MGHPALIDRSEVPRVCTLYVHKDEPRRCLAVSEGAPFPHHLNRSCWRLVAHGLAIGADAEWSLRANRFYEYVIRAI